MGHQNVLARAGIATRPSGRSANFPAMSPPLIKLGSCIGYAARLSRKMGAPREVSQHMQQALHYLTQFTKELNSPASAPPQPKRRRIIGLSNCLGVETSACHQSCQTDQRLVEEEEVVAQVAALVADMNAKSGQVQEFHKEVSQMVARQAQQHADARVDMEHSVAQLQVEMDSLLATIRDKDREIARLKTDTTFASVMASRVSCPLPDAAEHGPCEAARFLTIADAARLSQASSFHFGHLQDLHIEVDAPSFSNRI